MRPLWKGAITFGLISIPVRLYSAVDDKSAKFRLLHGEDQGRIKYQRICSSCGREVSWDDIIRGYEFSKDHYVTFSDEELENIEIDSVKAIDVHSFVPLEQIDPIYYNKTYFVAPEASGLKAYKLLIDALAAEGQVAVSKVSFRDKEHLATIRLKDGLFVLETMHWPDEIRTPEFEELEMNVELRDAEVKMARQLIQQLSSDFRPEDFRDEYREGLQRLADKKIEGQEVAIAHEASEEPTRVVDIMEALKASVAEARKKKEAQAQPASKKKEGQAKRPPKKKAAAKSVGKKASSG